MKMTSCGAFLFLYCFLAALHSLLLSTDGCVQCFETLLVSLVENVVSTGTAPALDAITFQ